MSGGLKILDLAESLAAFASARQTILSRNVAHADTPGYRAQDLTPFSQTYAAQEAAEDGLAFRPKATRPGHMDPERPPAGAEAARESSRGAASPNGNDVSLEDQMVRAADTRLQHELALGVWRKSLDILRAAVTPPR
ncbi:MAG: flagellar basal body rod protein FlgB [Pseudomonadota bacterium]|nr:flagellar basal body rod protein FlgB [Pseudomonadota bacterium]MEE3099043.1 flagellar basal body rod protein FlgB [Pseudomonadota bacterium]